jgi:hypothetical protein
LHLATWTVPTSCWRAGTVAEVTTPPSGRVTIAGRRFTLGAVYEAAPQVRPYEPGRLLPLRLVGYDPAYPWPKGRVEAELVGVQGTRRRTRRLSGQAWVRWAGEPVEDDLADEGRR